MKKYSQKKVNNVYISSLTSKKWYKPFCVVLTILTLILFFGASFFVGFGVRGCSQKKSVTSAYAEESVYSSVSLSYKDISASIFYFSSSSATYPNSLVDTFSFSPTFNINSNSSFDYSVFSLLNSDYVLSEFSELFVENNYSYDGIESDYVLNDDKGLTFVNGSITYSVPVVFTCNKVPAVSDFSDFKLCSFVYSCRFSDFFGYEGGLATFYINNKRVQFSYDYATFVFYRFDGLATLPKYNVDSYICFVFPKSPALSSSVYKSNISQISFLSSLSDFSSGYSSGYNVGYQAGLNSSDTTAYNNGYNLGYQAGLNKSLSDISPFSALVSGIDSFMQIKIFGSSVTLGLILSLSFGLVLLGIALKVFFHA